MIARARLLSLRENHRVGLFLAPLFALYFLTRSVNIKGVPIFIDEAIYLKWARDARAGRLWASLLWDGKPPLHSWSMVPLLGVFRDPLVAGRATSILFGALTTLGIFLIGKELLDWKLGAIAAFLYVACPFALWYDRLAIAESMLLALFVFAIYFAVKAARSGSAWYLIGTGIATGLALLTKGTATLIYPIAIFAYVVRDPREEPAEAKRPLVRWSVSIGVSLLVGFAILNMLRLSPKYTARSHFIATRTKGITAALATPLKTLLRFNWSIFISILKYLTPAVLVIALAGLALSLIKRWRPGYFLWLWLIIGVAVISLVGRFAWPRFYLVLVPPLLLAAAYLLYEAGRLTAGAWSRSGQSRKKLLMYSTSVALLILLIATAVPVASELSGMVQAKQGEGEYLKGRCAGVGLKETANLVKGLSRREKINVVVNDYFIQVALEMYASSPNVNVITLKLEYRKGYSELLKSTIERAACKRPTYVVMNGASGPVPSSWPLHVMEEFKKNDGGNRVSMYLAKATGFGQYRASLGR